jgi:hypothetical protein
MGITFTIRKMSGGRILEAVIDAQRPG